MADNHTYDDLCCVRRKQVLTKSKVEYMDGPGVYVVNVAQGCAHGCLYPCYAELMGRRFGTVQTHEQWVQPKPVANLLEQLHDDLRAHLTRTSAGFHIYEWLENLDIEPATESARDRLISEVNRLYEKADCSFYLEPDAAQGLGAVIMVFPTLNTEYRQLRDLFRNRFNPKLRSIARALGIKMHVCGTEEPVNLVHMCFSTDPLPYISPEDDGFYCTFEQKAGVSPEDNQRLLRVMALRTIRETSLRAASLLNAQGIMVSLLTKGFYPYVESVDAIRKQVRLYDAFSGVSTHTLNMSNQYGITLTGLNPKFQAQCEPGAAPYADRIRQLKVLHNVGCYTWASLEPFPAIAYDGLAVPDGNFGEDSWHRGDRYDALRRVLWRIPFVDKIVFGRWNYSASMPTDQEDPSVWYQGASKVVEDFCVAHGISCVIKRGTADNQ